MQSLAGIFSWLRLRNTAVVLAYHSISESPSFGALLPNTFEQQMRFLHERKFNVVSLDKLAAYRKHASIPPKTVCITFDDGYRDNYTHAFPILRHYGFPATIFVATDYIGRDDWRTDGETFTMMNESELRELHASGLVSLQAHTASHRKLTGLDTSQVEKEVRTSRERLESLLGVPVQQFAYPKGAHSVAVREAVREAGVVAAYTVQPGFVRPGDNPLLLRRNMIAYNTSMNMFDLIARFGRISRSRFFV